MTGSCELESAVTDPRITVQVFAAGTTTPPLPITRVGDPTATPMDLLTFEGADAAPRFDVELPEGDRVDVRVVIYSGDVADYGALLENVAPSQDDLIVRLNPFGEWGCARSDDAGEGRALHAAVPLGDDQVLIFGGVEGDFINPASGSMPAAERGVGPARSIEVYDGRRHEFVPVETTGLDGSGFRRVLFDHVIVSTPAEEAAGIVRIRVVGGFSVSGATVLHFDNRGVYNPYGSPIFPVDGAVAGPTVDLVYDPADRTVNVEEVPDADQLGSTGMVTIVGGLATGSLVPMGATFGLSSQVYPSAAGLATGVPETFAQPRLGATIEAVGTGYFVWGGDVSGDGIGEWFEFDSARTPIVAMARESTGFHSSTPLAGDFLIAGGFRIEPVAAGRAILSNAASLPIVRATVEAGGTLTETPVTSTGFTNTIFHTASSISASRGASGMVDLVVLVGGAAVADPTAPVPHRLGAQGQAGFVADEDMAPNTYQTLPNLRVARWGHTATPLSGHRLFVYGGFVDQDVASPPNAMRTTPSAEVFYWDCSPTEAVECIGLPVPAP